MSGTHHNDAGDPSALIAMDRDPAAVAALVSTIIRQTNDLDTVRREKLATLVEAERIVTALREQLKASSTASYRVHRLLDREQAELQVTSEELEHERIHYVSVVQELQNKVAGLENIVRHSETAEHTHEHRRSAEEQLIPTSQDAARSVALAHLDLSDAEITLAHQMLTERVGSLELLLETAGTVILQSAEIHYSIKKMRTLKAQGDEQLEFDKDAIDYMERKRLEVKKTLERRAAQTSLIIDAREELTRDTEQMTAQAEALQRALQATVGVHDDAPERHLFSP